MDIKFYMDVHIPLSITLGLRLRGIDVLTAQDDDSATLPDDKFLDLATELNRILVSFDDDLLEEATYRQRKNIPFSGVIYGHQLNITIGRCISDLELIAKAASPSEITNQVLFLPF
jgi:uncharacterized protein with PIN domain